MDAKKNIEEFNSKIKRVIISEQEIKDAISKVGKEIDSWYDGNPILLVSVLKGAFVFMADLCRAVSVPCEIGFMCAKSYYSGTTSSGLVNITMDLEHDVSKYHVVIVEDIIDTGRTLSYLMEYLKMKKPNSIKLCALLDKPERRVVDVDVDYVAFKIPDKFVAMYGRFLIVPSV